MNSTSNKIRQSNMEWLRVLAMILIVAHHFVIHSGFAIGNELTNTNALLKLLYMGGKVGVVIFVTISGYFMVQSQISITKIFQLWGQVVFYNLLTAIFFYFVSVENVPASSLDTIRKSFFPIVYEQYWFITSFMILYLFSPFLNKMFTQLKPKEYLFYLGLSLLFFSIIPTFLEINLSFDHVTRFIFYYAIGAYIRLHPPQIPQRIVVLFALTLYGFIFYLAYTDLYDLNLITGLDSFFVVIFSAAMILLFSKLDVGQRPWINRIAKTTLGVYLIHDNQFLRPWIWKTVIRGPNYLNVPGFFWFAFAAIVAVFIGSAFLEWFRQTIFAFAKIVYDYVVIRLKVVIKRFRT
jgi:surface polysaccharide O-acyltransferase-like enzyme